MRDGMMRRPLWQYLIRWQEVKAPLNGKKLQQMGYQSGPHFREMLEALKAAMVDGEIGGNTPEEIDESARLFVLDRYPLSP